MDRAEFRKHLKELVQSKCIEREVPDASDWTGSDS